MGSTWVRHSEEIVQDRREGRGCRGEWERGVYVYVSLCEDGRNEDGRRRLQQLVLPLTLPPHVPNSMVSTTPPDSGLGKGSSRGGGGVGRWAV